jgi:hypothetical protein
MGFTLSSGKGRHIADLDLVNHTEWTRSLGRSAANSCFTVAIVLGVVVTAVGVFSPSKANRMDNAAFKLRYHMGAFSDWYQWELGARFFPDRNIIAVGAVILVLQIVFGLLIYAVITALAF